MAYQKTGNKETKTKAEKKKQYFVSTPKEWETKEGETKTSWTTIGIGFDTTKGIIIELNALPVNGKMYLQEKQEQNEEA